MSIRELVSVERLGDKQDFEILQKGATGYVATAGNKVRAVLQPNSAKFIAYLEFQPGETRGHEYHKQKNEFLTIIKGKLYATFYLPNEPTQKIEAVLEPGDFIMIKPGCAHTYTTKEGCTAIEYSPNKFDKNDIYKSSL